MFGSTSVTRQWVPALLTVVMLTVYLAASPGRAGAADLPMQAMLPIDTPWVVSMNTPYFWTASANIRKESTLSELLGKYETDLEISLENDFLSWSGYVAFTATNRNTKNANAILMLQIRDAAIFQQKFGNVQALLEKKTNTDWNTVDVDGRQVRRTLIPFGDTILYTVDVLVLNGWLVITLGDNQMHQVITTAKGEAKAIKDHPLYAKAAQNFSPNNIVQAFFNGDAFIKTIPADTGYLRYSLISTGLDQEFTVATAADNTDGLNIDVITCNSLPMRQEDLQVLRTEIGTIAGKSLPMMPDGTSVAILMNSPDKWMRFVSETMMNRGMYDSRYGGYYGGDLFWEFYYQFLSIMDSAQPIIRRTTGEFSASAAFRTDKGAGVTIMAETRSNNTANYLANYFYGLATNGNGNAVEKTNNFYTMKEAFYKSKYMELRPGWTTLDQWIIASSHPDWITEKTVKLPLKLPANAKDASAIFFGNLDFAVPLLETIKIKDPEFADQIHKIFAGTDFKNCDWSSAISIDKDGGAVRWNTRVSSKLVQLFTTASNPVYTMYHTRETQSQTMSDLNYIAMRILENARQNDDTMPVMETSNDLRKFVNLGYHYSESTSINSRNNIRYLPNPFLSGRKLGDEGIGDPAIMVLIYEETATDGFRYVAFLDGHVATVSDAQWEQVRQASKIP